MGAIGDSIEAALQGAQTRPLPKSAAARVRVILRAEKGSTRAVADRLGCSQRQVERYLSGQAHRPTPRLAAAIEREARRSWQPGIRQRVIRQAARAGITIETRARFGFTAAAGSTDDPRMRRITEQLDPADAAQLLAAHAAGADEAQLQALLGQGLGYSYFRAQDTRAHGLDVAITDIDYLDVEL
ncbi:telomere-protecting terminal protein Tpg [Streptomyces litchfieldiae]|uniref:Helix-turn-helix transcriptional regulator n=1 Tax=Streptomyces litchfieldiae TaxID=3075543 RepID=A0ABU2N1F6_9ACTN|nr:helix-turn-helix transcriptional regulator [Streptomyces sp. DSM 44938]MDT0347736.1 helix-turn-helix transcriptional regulator [Streptomyces sp. DSM 44938]